MCRLWKDLIWTRWTEVSGDVPVEVSRLALVAGNITSVVRCIVKHRSTLKLLDSKFEEETIWGDSPDVNVCVACLQGCVGAYQLAETLVVL